MEGGEMTNEQINIAIAESLGWRKITQFSQYPKSWGGKPARYDTPVWRLTLRHDLEEDECHKYGWKGNKGDVTYDGPNYTADLNACHEFESEIIYSNDRLPKKYTQQIKSAICREAGVKKAQMDFDLCITATARQRCEAYLRTLNLWK